ncbi:flagellar hook-associated protein 2 [Ectobacillus sp. JY-23]|uniref:flagellar hook-associated protein 2 n=1 Tax=Ectobacillus sp. JY-23 TaxID=2933872 RepID=UPI001FF3489E|nr:flagellar hook-associated protein 2 [Ectobacillus sp. JY-23]UOY93391.1 flagellar hook-associated protein 2 [Ectobacillus sp. JY-23]
MAGTVTAYGSNGTQIWGLGNNLINTADLVEMELQALEARKSPMLRQKNTATTNKQTYSNFQNDFSSLIQAVRKVASFTGSEKAVTLSTAGYVDVKAGASAISGSYKIEVAKLATRHQVGGGTAINLAATVTSATGVKLNGKDIVIDAGMTYKQLIDKINGGDYGVSVYTIKDATGDRLYMTAKNSGVASAITIESGTGSLWQDIGIVDGSNAFKNIIEAQDAEYSINGVSLTNASNTVENILPGVSITLTTPTPANTPVTVNVGDSSVNDSVSIIQAMSNEYNNAISKLGTYGGEGGVLQGSNAVLTTSKALGTIGTFQVNGKYASSYGIQMDKTGRITIDTTKLQDAFKKDPDGAKAFFFSVNGLGKHLEKQLDKVFGETGSIGSKIKSYDEELQKINKQITKIDELNRSRQDAIIAKYAKLEQQMAALNTQLNYIKAATKTDKDD